MQAVELLAAGRHSRVLLCRGTDGAPVLLKATRLIDQQTAERAQREIEFASSSALLGGFVVRSRGWLVVDAVEAYVWLDWLPGGSIELLVDREGSLNPAAARFYSGCLALALEALHAQGVLHRDVKPDNLCVGADGYAKLVDLAYARVLPATADGRLHTLLGTPEYLSPEAFTGAGQALPSDVWAFGVSLYEMLLSSLPWQSGENPQELYASVLARPPFFPLNICPTSAKQLIESCLSKEPDKRPTVRDLWQHDFYRYALPPSAAGGLDREALLARTVTPPFVPRLSSPFDTRHFRTAEEVEEQEAAGRGGGLAGSSLGPVLAVTQPGGQTSVGVRGEEQGALRAGAEASELTLAAGAEALANYRPPEEPCADAFTSAVAGVARV